jgi:hypothetical protein
MFLPPSHPGKTKGDKAKVHFILSPDLEIESVMAKRRLLIHQNQFLVKGTFEIGT